MKISNYRVFGIDESILASGYPMQAKIKNTLEGNDLTRAINLGHSKSGSGHDCYLKGITVQMDITASHSWWMQAQRYHWFDIVSSQSKMHKILSMDIKNQCSKYVSSDAIFNLEQHIKMYESGIIPFEAVIHNCPLGLNLTARITTNFLQLKTIHSQRKSHRLQEWKDFCKFLEDNIYMFKKLVL